MDPGLDTITVYLNRTFIGDRYHLDISTYTINPFVLADEIQNVRSDAQPPVKRAPPPAGVLGYISGYHSRPGPAPLGWCPHRPAWRSPWPEINILNAAEHSGVPVALLDIRIQPAWLP